ncbi:hypothetical protein CLV59_10241 [Chitinophaga dinghuensis]|uniref:Tetratricopeptide repeat protein n=1 Tax=Chitinophaga dinghuensis TaxID=1539050 RepID=A0A327W5R7_9BACT|nr:hypothetical protein [Chitinophaga dinghuensis]RAJ85340.1 hypothetical protein CLV59_10241 [Chitinophaga dinghuensis]
MEYEQEEGMEAFHDQEMQAPTNCCISCHSPSYEDGYSTKLCTECRKKLSQYPIDKKVKIGALLVLAIFIFSLTLLPARMKLGLNYAQALKMMETHHYKSALNLLEPIAQKYSKELEVEIAYTEALLYSSHLPEADSMIQKLSKVSFSDNGLLKKAQQLSDELNHYRLDDEHVTLLDNVEESDPKYIKLLDSCLAKASNNEGLLLTRARYALSQDNYQEYETLGKRLLAIYPHHMLAQKIVLNSYFLQLKYKEAAAYAALILKDSPEDEFAMTMQQKIHAALNSTDGKSSTL